MDTFLHTINSLLKRFAYETGDFTLASGAKSSEYLDVKNAILQPGIGWDLAVDVAHSFGTARAIAGVAIGGAMLARLVAGVRFLPTLIVRPEPKEHGKASQVDGLRAFKFNAPADQIEVVLIEDVITSGSSVVKALHALAKDAKQCKVTAVRAVVDRQAGGMEYLRKEFPGIDFQALTTLEAIRNA
jgi:orotate phosphoribosyltransferase